MIYILAVLLLQTVTTTEKIFHIGPSNLYSILVPESTKTRITKNDELGDTEHLMISRQGKPKFVISISFENADTITYSNSQKLKEKISLENDCKVNSITSYEKNNFFGTKMNIEGIEDGNFSYSGHYYLILGSSKLVTMNVIIIFIESDIENKILADEIMNSVIINF